MSKRIPAFRKSHKSLSRNTPPLFPSGIRGVFFPLRFPGSPDFYARLTEDSTQNRRKALMRVELPNARPHNNRSSAGSISARVAAVRIANELVLRPQLGTPCQKFRQLSEPLRALVAISCVRTRLFAIASSANLSKSSGRFSPTISARPAVVEEGDCGDWRPLTPRAVRHSAFLAPSGSLAGRANILRAPSIRA